MPPFLIAYLCRPRLFGTELDNQRDPLESIKINADRLVLLIVQRTNLTESAKHSYEEGPLNVLLPSRNNQAMSTTIPACNGVATFLSAGQTIKVINTHGTQVIDAWAFTLSPSRTIVTQM